MRILELRAENVRRLSAVRMAPNGGVVVIAGRNAQGKTSVLDAIALVLEGAAFKVETPVRRGAKEGWARLIIGDEDDPASHIFVTRTWKKGGATTSLKIMGPDGVEKRSPQAALDELVGRVAFDPGRFASMKPKERRSELMRLLGLGEVLAELEARRLEVYDSRTAVGRVVERLSGTLKTLDAPAGPEEVEVSIQGLLDELEKDHKETMARQAYAAALQRTHADWKAAAATANRLRDELIDAEAAVKAKALAVEAARAALAALPEPVEGKSAEVPAQYAAAAATNKAMLSRNEARRRRATIKAEHDEAKGTYDEHSMVISCIDAERAHALKTATFPLEGLAFGDDDEGDEPQDVTYNGILFGDLSASEKIRVGLALAAAANPGLRVALIRDGSLLDEEVRSMLAAYADANDLQVWLEVVGQGGNGAWVIEDGELASGDSIDLDAG